MPPPPIAPKKAVTKLGKNKSGRSSTGLSPRGYGDDGSDNDIGSDEEGNPNNSGPLSASLSPRPFINPLILHGPEEVLQLADNAADVEEFCHRLVEDLVEMVQDCMLASHVDRIAVPWTVQDVIAQLYAGMHFCIAERDCPAPNVIGPQVAAEREDITVGGGGATLQPTTVIAPTTSRRLDDEEEPLNAQQVMTASQTPLTGALVPHTDHSHLSSPSAMLGGTPSHSNTSQSRPLKEMAIAIPTTDLISATAATRPGTAVKSHADPTDANVVTRQRTRLPLFHKAPPSIDYDPAYGPPSTAVRGWGSPDDGDDRWIDYKADVVEPAHIPADSWSRGVIAVRKRLFNEGSSTINTSVINGSRGTAVDSSSIHLGNTVSGNTTAGKRASLRPGTANTSSSIVNTSVISRSGSAQSVGGVRGGPTKATVKAGSRPSTSGGVGIGVGGKGNRRAGGKTGSNDGTEAEATSTAMVNKISSRANFLPPRSVPSAHKLGKADSPSSPMMPLDRTNSSSSAVLLAATANATTLELLQSNDDGLKEEDKRIIAEDRSIREHMAKLKASSLDLSRQLEEIKPTSNFIVDQRSGKVILQNPRAAEKLEPIEGSISVAQTIANSPSPPPAAINNGVVSSGIIPLKIVTIGGSAPGEKSDQQIAAEAAAAEAAALDTQVGRRSKNSVSGRPMTSPVVSPVPAKAKVPRPKKLPASTYFAVESRIANPMIASQVIPSGGVSSKEGDSILTADLPTPPLVAGVRPMSKQEFLRAQKDNGSPPPQFGGGGTDSNAESRVFNGEDLIDTTPANGVAGRLAAALSERPQSTPPDITAAATAAAGGGGLGGGGVTRLVKKHTLILTTDDASSQRGAPSLLNKFGKLSTTITNTMAVDETANSTAAFNNYRGGGVTLPPRPASTNTQPILGKVRKDVFVPNASRLSQQEEQTAQALLFAQQQRLKNNSPISAALSVSALQQQQHRPNSTLDARPHSSNGGVTSLTPVVVPSRRHFKPIFDERGNVRPPSSALAGASPLNRTHPLVNSSGVAVVNASSTLAGDTLAAANALKYVLAKREAKQHGGHSRPSSAMDGGYEAINVEGSAGDLMR